MKRAILILALASAAGLVFPAVAQQGETAGEPPQVPAEPRAAEASADEPQPRSPEETLADHLRSFLARAEQRRQTSGQTAGDVERQSEIRYHPAW